MTAHFPWLTFASLGCAALSAVILVGYLVSRPPLTWHVKGWLLVGLGVLPIGAALSGNVQGYEATKQRSFCASCHVMKPWTSDSDNTLSASLSSRHGRNKLFGKENCYTCHEDYGMFGTVMTKIGGLNHVWKYETEYRNVSVESAKKTIRINKPFPNDNCMQCHSTAVTLWLEVPNHRLGLDVLRADKMSCAYGGCHGFAHPNIRPTNPAAL